MQLGANAVFEGIKYGVLMCGVLLTNMKLYVGHCAICFHAVMRPTACRPASPNTAASFNPPLATEKDLRAICPHHRSHGRPYHHYVWVGGTPQCMVAIGSPPCTVCRHAIIPPGLCGAAMDACRARWFPVQRSASFHCLWTTAVSVSMAGSRTPAAQQGLGAIRSCAVAVLGADTRS